MKRRIFCKAGIAGAGIMPFAENTWALKYYPKPSENNCAVLYGTWCGSSRDAAIWISEGMGGIADVFDVREKPDLKGFNHIILGGSIRNNVTSEELQEYINKNNEWLNEKVRGLFAVCGNMGNPVGPKQKTMFINNHLAKLCMVGNVSSTVFLGRITKSLMDPQTAKMMERMEDYDNLKRADCMAFGKEVLASI
ncbi:flavodoxin domain-containing protein [Candidatus Latescibacterota bacterium]